MKGIGKAQEKDLERMDRNRPSPALAEAAVPTGRLQVGPVLIAARLNDLGYSEYRVSLPGRGIVEGLQETLGQKASGSPCSGPDVCLGRPPAALALLPGRASHSFLVTYSNTSSVHCVPSIGTEAVYVHGALRCVPRSCSQGGRGCRGRLRV